MRRIAVWALLLLLTAGLLAVGCGAPSRKYRRQKAPSRLPQQQTQKPPTAPATEPPSVMAPQTALEPRTETPAPPPPFSAEPPPPSTTLDLTRLPLIVNRLDGSKMVLVPNGSYFVSVPGIPEKSDLSGQSRLYPLPLPGFYIDRNEITVEQYQRFTAASGGDPSAGNASTCPKCPALGVSLEEALTYCQWAGKDLPTEAQWEAAARGAVSQPFPWGVSANSRRANLAGDADGNAGPAPVGSYPLGASIFGVEDMIGNAWEWVKLPEPPPQPSPSSTPPAAPPSPDPSRLEQGPPPGTAPSSITNSDPAPVEKPPPSTLGLVKGGGFRSPPAFAGISVRNLVPPALRNPSFGFRCIKPQRRR